MKRLITTLAIILVVMVVGMTALVLLVNPNDFRAYMIEQVEQRSGYQLALNGNLRWHVWPQLSILSGPISLTAQGATQPIVRAENMRLDVNLLPLISHQLSVRQVMLKGAVVSLIPQSAPGRPANAPVGPRDNTSPSTLDVVTRGWKFDISHLKISDSLLVWQQDNGEQLNIRDLNLELDQAQPRQADLQMSGRISRDQRELQLQLDSEIDIRRYPQQLSATVKQFNYQLSGAVLPQVGIKGQATMSASWHDREQRFTLDDIQLVANDSRIAGSMRGTLGARPQVFAELTSPRLNLDSLFGINVDANLATLQQASYGTRPPVIANARVENYPDSVINSVDGSVDITVSAANWRGISANDVHVKAESQQGLIELTVFNGRVGDGSFSLPGNIDARKMPTTFVLKPSLRNVDLPVLLKSLELPEKVDGKLTLKGNFSGEGLSVDQFKHHWRGSADLTLDQAQFVGLNFQQMVQRAVENSSNKVRGQQSENSQLQQIRGHGTLDRGVITFSELNGQANSLGYSGKGYVDLAKKQLDINFGIKVLSGWQGDDELIKRLQQTSVPLRIFGPWYAINYNLKVDRVLREQLRDEAKQRLQEWMNQNPQRVDTKDRKEVLKELQR